MQERYEAARVISVLPVSDLKDVFWVAWKKAVHAVLSSLLVEISSFCAQVNLTAGFCFARGRQGATFYIDSNARWAPPATYQNREITTPPLPLPTAFVWNPAKISPTTAYSFQVQWTNASQRTGFQPKQAPIKSISTATSVPLCTLLLLSSGFKVLPRRVDVASLMKRAPYTTTYTYVQKYLVHLFLPCICA